MHKIIFLLLFYFSTNIYSYEDPNLYSDLDEKFFVLKVHDPKQKVGYTVGDFIAREIDLEIKEPYKLIEESLPIEGYEKRYRGQVLGIILQKIQTIKNKNNYKINLKYQIFTNNVVAKPASITADYFRVINKNNPKEVLKIRIPSFTFAISPIAIFGEVKVENDMSDFRGPILKENLTNLKNIYLSIFFIMISSLVLLYIYTRFTLLPGFKKTFLPIYKKYRKIKSLNENTFIRDLHNGLNQMSNKTLFQNNLNDLYKNKMAFKSIHEELIFFFALSNNILFKKKKITDKEIAWLKKFSFHCHCCEKGLNIDKQQINNNKI